MSGGRGSELANPPRSGLRICKIKSLPNHWHKLALEPRHASLRLNRRSILGADLMEPSWAAFPRRSYSAKQICWFCGVGGHIQTVKPTLDPVDQLVRCESDVTMIGVQVQNRRLKSRVVTAKSRAVRMGWLAAYGV